MKKLRIVIILIFILSFFSFGCSQITEIIDRLRGVKEEEPSAEEQENLEQVEQIYQEFVEGEEENASENTEAETEPDSETEPEAEPETETGEEQEEEEIPNEGVVVPESDPVDVILGDPIDHINHEDEVTALFFVENPNTEWAMKGAQATIICYNNQEVVVNSTDIYINLILPGERRGIVTNIYLDEGVWVSAMEVLFNPGDYIASIDTNPFTSSNVNYYEGDWYPIVSGVIHNSLDKMVTGVRVDIVGYDVNGGLNSGTYQYIDFIPANGYAAFSVNVSASEPPNQIEVYASVYNFDYLGIADYQDYLQIESIGYSFKDQDIGAAFLVNNPDTGNGVLYSIYQAAAYDFMGNVLDTDWGYIDYVFPDSSQAYVPDLYMPPGTNLDKIEVQVMSGDLIPDGTIPNPFTTETVDFVPDQYSPRVIGMINNNSDEVFENILAYAVVYDLAGDIIGGGYGWVEYIPANGTAMSEVYVTVDPALEIGNVGLFPAVPGDYVNK